MNLIRHWQLTNLPPVPRTHSKLVLSPPSASRFTPAMRATLCARSEAPAVPRAPVEPPEQPTDNPGHSRGVDATWTRSTNSAGRPPKHQAFQFSPGAAVHFGRGRPDGVVAAQTPLKDGQGSYQLAYKERDRYLRTLEAYMALRIAGQPRDA